MYRILGTLILTLVAYFGRTETLQAAIGACGTPTDLIASNSVRVDLTEAASQACFHFEASAGRSMVITIADAAGDPEDFVSLFLKWGLNASGTAFNRVANDPSPNQRLVVPQGQDATAFITVQGTFLNGGTASVDLLVTESTFPLVESIVPTYQGIGGDRIVRARISGASLSPDTRFILERADCPDKCMPAGTCAQCYPSIATDAVFPESAKVNFDLSEATPGFFNLVALRDGDISRLENAFELRATNNGPVLFVEIDGQAQYRDRYPSTFTLRVRNGGDFPMAAPILRVLGPTRAEFTELTISGKPFSQIDELYVLAYPPSGVNGMLSQGVEVEIPIDFQSKLAHECPEHRCDQPNMDGCDTKIRVAVFEPSGKEALLWPSLDAPLGMEAIWNIPGAGGGQNIRLALANRIGTTWRSFHASMVTIATRLSQRNQPTYSVAELFRFAVREALGRPAAAISGTLRDETTKQALPGHTIYAVEGGITKSSTLVDGDGRFTLDWLERGATYDLKVVRFGGFVTQGQELSTDRPSVTLPLNPSEFNDLVGITILADTVVGPSGLTPECGNCDQSNLPREPIKAPCAIDPQLYFQYANLTLQIIGSFDPNEKDGSGSEGGGDLIQPDEQINYTVYFENISGTPDSELADHGAAARNVFVRDDLMLEAVDPDSGETVNVLDAESVTFDRLYIEVEPAPIDISFNGLDGPFFYNDGGTIFEGLTICALSNGAVCDYSDLYGSLGGACLDLLFASIGGSYVPADSCLNCSACWLGEVNYHAGEPESITVAVSATADLNVHTGRIEWAIVGHADWDSLPLETGFLPFGCASDDDEGEDDGPIEMNACSGLVTFTISPAGADLGDEFQLADEFGICNDADIIFDHSRYSTPDDVISTNVVTLTVQRQVPGAPVDLTSEENKSPDATRLSWESAYADSYELYIWTACQGDVRANVEEFAVIEINDPLTLGDERLREPVYPPVGQDALELPDEEHYWQVVAFNQHGSTESDVWSLFSPEQPSFRRGDANASGIVDLSDPLNNLEFQFLGTFQPACMDALDTDDSGLVDLSDPILNLTFLFLGGVDIPAPGPNDCGVDPTQDGPDTEDELGCEEFACECN